MSIPGIILLLVALSALIVISGLLLKRQGKLRSRGAVGLWVILAVAPIFGAGFAKYASDQVDRADDAHADVPGKIDTND